VVQIVAFLPSVMELGFPLFDGGAATLSQVGVMGIAGPPCTLGKQASCTICRIVGYHFPPLSRGAGFYAV
jgi:hypothetical protein